jgi:hypothetical protein
MGFWMLAGALALLWRKRRPSVTPYLPTEVTS